MLRTLLLLVLFAARSAAAETTSPASFPTEIKLTSGAVLRNTTVLRWTADSVVVKHAGGADPVRFAYIAEPYRSQVLAARKFGAPGEAKAKADAAAKAQKAQDDYNADLAAEERAKAERRRFEDMADRRAIAVGMPVDLLLKAWGEPIRKNYASSGPQQWVYPAGAYVYIDAGKISHWQASDR
jgi:hypothetical protein